MQTGETARRPAPERPPGFVPGRCGRSFLYKTELYGIKSALPGRQHERGFPLSNSPQRRGPAPRTPRQRFAAAPRPAPGAGPVETPRRHPQDQLTNIAAQAQNWTHVTPHYSSLFKAITDPDKTTNALNAGKSGAALHGSFLARSAPRLPQPDPAGPRPTGHRHAPPQGGPALHPRPRFARPRPLLGPPCQHRRPANVCLTDRPQITLQQRPHLQA